MEKDERQESVEAAHRAYAHARGTPEEAACAEAFIGAVLACGDAPPSRAILDAAFWAANDCKKANKVRGAVDGVQTGNAARFVHFARQVIGLRALYNGLPEAERPLRENQVGAYAWAVYAVATGSLDADEARAQAELFVKIHEFRTAHGWKPEELDMRAYEKVRGLLSPNRAQVEKAVALGRSGDVAGCVKAYHEALRQAPLSAFDAKGYGWKMVKRIWDGTVRGRELRELMSDFLRLSKDGLLPVCDDNAVKIRHGFLIGLAKRIHALEKGEGGNRVAIPYDVAVPYLEILEQDCDDAVREEDFVRRPVTAEERARMERSAGKKVRLKEWPSNVETMVGGAARIVKEHAFTPAKLLPGERLMAFLEAHLDEGEWFGFYYAMWLKAAGRTEEGTRHLLKTVEAKRNEAWAWDHLGETYVQEPEKARACYCRALTCPVHDEEISAGIAKKTHRKLAAVLRALGEADAADAEEALASSDKPLPGRRDVYLGHVDEADLLLLGDRKTRVFEGVFEQNEGRAFGFVRCGSKGRDNVFVPPPRTRGLRDGDRVKGTAVLELDRKKGRESWSAAVIRRL